MRKDLLVSSLIVMLSMFFSPTMLGQNSKIFNDAVKVVPEHPSPTDSLYVVYSYVSNDGCPDYYLVKDSTTVKGIFVSAHEYPDVTRVCTMVITRFETKINIGTIEQRTEIYFNNRRIKVIDPTRCTMDKTGRVVAVVEQSSILKEQRTGDEYAINDTILKEGTLVQFNGTRIQCVTTPCYNIVNCYKVIAAAGEFSLAGQATADSQIVPSGIVILFGKEYRKAINSVPLNNDGTFEFTGISKGAYTVLVIPTHSLFRKYLPTFYIDKLRYRAADYVSINDDYKGMNVQLRTYNRPNGKGRIYGNMHFESTNLKDSVIAGYAANKRNAPANASLADNLSVILFNANKEPVDWTVTDDDGNYSFDDLPFDTYTLVSETANASGETEVNVSDQTSVINADLMLKSIAVNTDTRDFNKNYISVFPNPVTTSLTVTLPSSQLLHIYNTMGQEVKNIPLLEGSNTVDVSTLNQGIYFFRVNQTSVKVMKK